MDDSKSPQEWITWTKRDGLCSESLGFIKPSCQGQRKAETMIGLGKTRIKVQRFFECPNRCVMLTKHHVNAPRCKVGYCILVITFQGLLCRGHTLFEPTVRVIHPTHNDVNIVAVGEVGVSGAERWVNINSTSK